MVPTAHRNQDRIQSTVLLRILPAVLFLLLTVVPVKVYASGKVETSFRARLESFKNRAEKLGVAPSVLEDTFKGLTPDSTVIRNLENQPEFTLSYSEYRNIFLTDTRVRRGRTLLQSRKNLLDELQEKYGLPPHVLLAVWGVESNYGHHESQYDVVRSIATLAFTDSGRRKYFEDELLSVMKILDRELIDREKLRGSWAGAMGDPQFMPSSFLTYAVDYDRDGNRNIWDSERDILASIANYLEKNGWTPNEPWGTEDLSRTRTWNDTRVIEPEGSKRRFGVTKNFDVLMSYNPSTYYALVVGELSEEIRKSRSKGRKN